MIEGERERREGKEKAQLLESGLHIEILKSLYL